MQLKPGRKLRSAVSDAQVVVVRAPDGGVELCCGGVPLLEEGQEPGSAATLDPTLDEGLLMGKRYVEEELGIEVLCTKAGEGTLTADGHPLLVKGAKPLPSSD